MYRPIFQGDNMNFWVLNRESASVSHPKVRSILISITDPDEPLLDIQHPEAYLGVLRLSFHDVERILDGYPEVIPFTENDAESIINFIDNYKNDIELVVVHCEAGISRSAGVAAALSLILNNDCGFFHEYYYPNTLVKSIILRKANYYNFE
jgi:predicted protein tyrosine phosphatase